MSFRATGRLVPRDADQQEDAGTPVDERARPGDLVSYGDAAPPTTSRSGSATAASSTPPSARARTACVEEPEPDELARPAPRRFPALNRLHHVLTSLAALNVCKNARARRRRLPRRATTNQTGRYELEPQEPWKWLARRVSHRCSRCRVGMRRRRQQQQAPRLARAAAARPGRRAVRRSPTSASPTTPVSTSSTRASPTRCRAGRSCGTSTCRCSATST